MALEALDLSLRVVRSLRQPLARIRSRDRKLHDQIRDAASSSPLNLAEGCRRVGKDRTHLWRIAAGSADEVRTALRVAQAWDYLERRELEQSFELLDRLLAMCWRLTN